MTFEGTRREADAMPRARGRKLRVLLLQLSANLDINTIDRLHIDSDTILNLVDRAEIMIMDFVISRVSKYKTLIYTKKET